MISLMCGILSFIQGTIIQNPIYYVASGIYMVSYQLYRLREKEEL